jgi:DNA repair exonuclease SbcCD nuclease subunit
MTELLAVGDIHLGRSPAALHPDLQHRRAELGPEATWARCVELAIDRSVDAVLLAGDVVERSRDLLVAYGDLKQGVERLAAASIPVIAVAGNHDTLVLPRLAAEIPGLELLGSGGKWQQRAVGKLKILGWSFPRTHVRQNPLDTMPTPDQPQQTVGLLHCDLDQADSPYAPVTSAGLKSSGLAAWLLGHVHQPSDLAGQAPMGYLGSVTALRASDTGPRGPWLVTFKRQHITLAHQAIAPLRYDSLAIDVSQLDGADQLGEAILAGARKHIAELREASFLPEVVGLRLALTGACEFEAALPETVDELLGNSRPWQEGPISVFIQKITIQTRPAVDLERLAMQDDPCGLLARRMLILDDVEHPEHDTLIAQARPALAAVSGQKEFRHVDPPLDDHEVRRWLRDAGRTALNQLLDQKRSTA